jgi:tetratricopeptide (TPR) repeat protein
VLGSLSGLAFIVLTLALGWQVLLLAVSYELRWLAALAWVLLGMGGVGGLRWTANLFSRRARLLWYRKQIEDLRRAGEVDWCIAAGRRAIATMAGDPRYREMEAGTNNQLGVAYFCKGEYRSALEHYEKALQLTAGGPTYLGIPGHKKAIAWANVAEARIALGEYAGAAAAAEAAVQEDPVDSYAQTLLAEAKLRQALRLLPEGKLDFADVALRGARTTLGHLGPFGSELLPGLESLLRDPDKRLRWLASEVLRDMGPPAEPAVAALVEAARGDSEGYVRGSAVVALRHIRRPEGEIVRALVQALTDADSFVRHAAVTGLADMNQCARDVLEALRKVAASDADARVRQVAERAVAHLSCLPG